MRGISEHLAVVVFTVDRWKSWMRGDWDTASRDDNKEEGFYSAWELS